MLVSGKPTHRTGLSQKNAGEGNDYLTAIKNGSEYTLLDETFSCGYTDKQAEAVATLSAACGAAALMDYGKNSSNAYSTDYGPALCKYMGYDESLNFIEASYFTESGWIERIQNELLSNRPILCSGRSENNFGHAFIIDGYEYRDGSPYFHVNWGWNGFSNGYFLINVLQPSEAGIGGSTENYGYDLTLIMDIKPDNDKDDGFVFGATSVTTDASSANVGDRVSVSATELCNRSPYEFAGKIQLYAVDEMQNEFVIGTYMTISSLKLLSYYPSVSNSLQIPTAIPTGNYTLQLRAIADGSSVENAVLTPTCPQIHITNNDMFIVGQAVSAEDNHAKKLVYDNTDKCYKYLEDGNQEQPIMMTTGQPFVFATNLFYQEDENVPVSLVDEADNSTEADTYMANGTNFDTQYCNFLSKNTSATAGYSDLVASIFNLPTGEYYIRLYADGDQAYYLIRRAYSFSYCDSENKIENYNTWKTFCDYHAVVIPDGVEVLYVNSSDNTNNEVTLKKYPLYEPTEGVRVLPAGAAVILARTTDGNEAKPSIAMDYYAEPNFSESSYSEKPTDNLLKGQIHSAKLEREADGKANFVFGRKLNSDNKYVVGFYYAGDYNCPINLAYLQLDKNSIGDNAESKGWRLTLDDSETNGISHLTNGSEASDDGYYTLQGVKVTTPKAKGIYVHKGNKIIIK